MKKLIKDCSTCAYYAPARHKSYSTRHITNTGVTEFCQCTNPKITNSSAYIDIQDACGPQRNYRYWEPNHKYTLVYEIEQCTGNVVNENDYYEVYEHTTDQIVYERVSLFRKIPKNVKYYYVKKNGEYYECSDEKIVGFIPLEDPLSYEYLKKYDSLSDAIASTENYRKLTNPELSLVYSTKDLLETKFQDMERKKHR